jgi:hypothetical protein
MKEYIEKIKKVDSRLLMFGAIVVLALLLLQQCGATRNAKTDLAMANQNIFALNDSIRISKNRVGELQYEKGVLITSEKGLRDLNEELYNELKKQRDDIAFLQKIVGKLSTPVPQQPIPGTGGVTGRPCDSIGTYYAEWEDYRQFDADNYRRLKAKTDITVKYEKVTDVKTSILTDEIGFDLITGIKENSDGNFEIFVKSNYPGFTPTKIDGAFIPRKDLFPPQKKKNWSVGVGPQIGVGVGGLATPGPVWYFGLGLGLQYTFFRF